MKVRFNYVDRTLNGLSKSALKDMVKNIFINEMVALDTIDYIFCSDEYLLDINKRMLNHDYYTDIITFPLHSKNQPIVSEIYISLDRVKENATIHQTSYKKELARVIAHGSLHLCGYKDKTKKDIAIMRNKESFYIRAF